MGRVEGKVAVVTGAGSGIGAATALVLAQEGAKVAVADISTEGAQRTVDLIEEAGGTAFPVTTDVSSEQQVHDMIGVVIDAYGKLDILHNNAAATSAEVNAADSTIVETDVETWDHVLAVNLRGYFLGCKHAIPKMIAGGGGSIINTTSGMGEKGFAVHAAYGASKGGVNALTYFVATQYGRQRIRCNALNPGFAATEGAMRNAPKDLLDSFASRILLPGWGTLEDRAKMVLFLASDDAAYITGHSFTVDGGLQAHAETLPPFEGDPFVDGEEH